MRVLAILCVPLALWIHGLAGTATDTDGDGLTDDVESEIGTCISRLDDRAGLSCASIADPRDTDGDGLMDGWEVLGYDAARYGVVNGATLPLQAWGADPRHKDLFVEVDYRRLDASENAAGTDRRMTAQAARELAAIFADSATTDAALRSEHASSLGNPDGQPGVRIHLDIGRDPEMPGDAAVYGNWGGHNAVDAIVDPESPGGYRPASPGVWPDQMTRSRHGIFHYVLGYTTGAGQCGFGVACEFNFELAETGAHELGHNLGFDHGGPYEVAQPNCKPNYPSLMSYAGGTQFSDGRNLGVLNNHRLAESGAIPPGSPLLERLRTDYLYKVDETTGSVDWDRDGKFMPKGRFVRAYANFKPGASCEFTRAGEAPTGQVSNRTPAIVRHDNHLWVFAVGPDKVLTFTLTPQPLTCSDVDTCAPVSFHNPARAEVGPVDAVDAVAATVGGGA